MSILQQSATFSPKTKTVVTVGTFDGVHLGHQKIIRQLVSFAQEKGTAATLLTFDPHPRKVVQPNASVALIQTLEERAETLADLGLTYMVVHPFTKASYTLRVAPLCCITESTLPLLFQKQAVNQTRCQDQFRSRTRSSDRLPEHIALLLR